MEPSYRYLIKKLFDNDLVKKLKYDHYCIRIQWVDGVKEKWIIPRNDNPNKSFRDIYRPLWLQHKLWPEEVSNGLEMKPLYINGVDPILNDVNKKGLCSKFLWSDYQKLGFYEKSVFPHQLIKFIVEQYDFENISYDDSVLNHSLQMVLDEPTKFFRYKNGYRYGKNYTNNEKPGYYFIEHFINFNYFGPKPLAKFNAVRRKRLVYKLIYRIISRNNRRIKAGKKPRYNFDVWSLRHVAMSNFRRMDPKPINYYRLLLEDLGLTNIEFLDLEPRFGEKAIANHLHGNKYSYIEVAPFDYAAKGMGDYLQTEFKIYDPNKIYDVAIVESEYRYNNEYAEYILNNYSKNVRNLFMFTDIENRDKFIELVRKFKHLAFGGPGKYIRITGKHSKNGYLMHIKQN